MKPRRPTWEWVALAAIAVVIAGWACWFNARQLEHERQEWEEMQQWQEEIRRNH